MDHVFGHPDYYGPGVDERYCTEPRVPGSKVARVYHVTYTMLEHGDFECDHCHERFLPNDVNTSS